MSHYQLHRKAVIGNAVSLLGIILYFIIPPLGIPILLGGVFWIGRHMKKIKGTTKLLDEEERKRIYKFANTSLGTIFILSLPFFLFPFPPDALRIIGICVVGGYLVVCSVMSYYQYIDLQDMDNEF